MVFLSENMFVYIKIMAAILVVISLRLYDMGS